MSLIFFRFLANVPIIGTGYWQSSVFWFVFLFATIVLALAYYLNHKFKKMHLELSTLHEIAQVRGMFVNITSHELRNPMTTIYSSVDLLETYGNQLTEIEKIKFFDNIRKSIRRMTDMMDSIVLIGKLQHKQISYNPSPVNILHQCASILETLESHGAKERVRMIMDSTLEPVVNIDPSLLDHILTNLLSNALKYSSEPVVLKIKTKNEAITFEVIDKGIGIPKSEIQQLSQLFLRCSNIGNRKGIGIGMYLVAHCIHVHQGIMQVFSQENEGTHFQFTLPNKNDKNFAY